MKTYKYPTAMMIRDLLIVVITAAACWLLFRSTLRVETVHRVGDGYIVEVSALGGTEIHECSL